jgi:hypothetical protein
MIRKHDRKVSILGFFDNRKWGKEKNILESDYVEIEKEDE